jgi:hypothetical protein
MTQAMTHVPVHYKQLPIGDLEAGKFDLGILENTFLSIYYQLIDKISAGKKINLCFFSAGSGRTELYIIERLLQEGALINEVIMCDHVYGNKTSAEYTALIKILSGFNFTYSLLASNNDLMIDRLQKGLKIMHEHHGVISSSSEAVKNIMIDAIIGIHYQSVNVYPPETMQFALNMINNISEQIDIANSLSLIELTFGNKIDFFPKNIIAYYRVPGPKVYDPYVVTIPLKPKLTKQIDDIRMIVTEIDRKYSGGTFIDPRDKPVYDKLHKEYRLLLQKYDNFIKDNPDYNVRGSESERKIVLQGGNGTDPYIVNKNMYLQLIAN